MKIKCRKCNNEWDYQGDKRIFATCPDCRALVRLTEDNLKDCIAKQNNDKRAEEILRRVQNDN